MKDQIIMSKTNGNCGVAIPLFRFHNTEQFNNIDGYVVSLTCPKPVAYAVDVGTAIEIVKAEFLEKNVEWLGDL